jgi:hypothetical protein
MNETFSCGQSKPVMNPDLQRQEDYAFPSCCLTALHTKPRRVAMHEVPSEGVPGVPFKWLFIMGSGAISGCEVTSEIYRL